MTPKLQQLLDSLAARDVQGIRLVEGQNAQISKNGAWSASSLQVTSALLDALALEDGDREVQTASGRYRAQVESGETRCVTLSFVGATNAQLKTAPAPPPMPGTAGGDKVARSQVGELKIAQSGPVRNVGARVGDLKGVPVPAPAAPVSPQQQQWFYAVDGEQIGPKSRIAMQSLIMGGTITRETLVWREGLIDWISAGESEFEASFPAVVPNQAAMTPQSNLPGYRDLGLDFNKENDRMATRQGLWAFGIGGIVIALAIVIPIALGRVRADNRNMNRVAEFERRVRSKENEADDVQLERTVNGFQVASEDSTTTSAEGDDVYKGAFLYSEGDRGEATVTIGKWDWLGRPASWDIDTHPVDFSSKLASRVYDSTSDDVGVSLTRDSSKKYSGEKNYYVTHTWVENGRNMKERYVYKKNEIEVTVISFDFQGEPDQIYVRE